MSDSLGSILGNLGDVISIGAGGDPLYRQEQNKQVVSKALQKYPDNPTGALSAMAGVDPAGAMAYQKQQQANSIAQYNAQSEAQRRTMQNQVDQDKVDQATLAHLIALGRTGNAQNWGGEKGVAAKLNAYKNARNYKGVFDVPEAFTDDWQKSLNDLGLEPKEREQTGETRRYHDAQISQAIANEEGRNNRYDQGEAGRNSRFNQGQAATESRFNRTQAGQESRFQRAQANQTARETAKETGRSDRGAARVIAQVVKNNPGALVQRSNTGKVRWSIDGGKTWNRAN